VEADRGRKGIERMKIKVAMWGWGVMAVVVNIAQRM
jgi:hypothetical protein